MKRYRLALAFLALVLGLGLLPYRLAQPSPMPAQGGRSLYLPLVMRNAAMGIYTAQGQTDSSGEVRFSDALAQRDVVVRAVDAATQAPLANRNVSFSSTGTKLLVIVEPPSEDYVPGLYVGSYQSLYAAQAVGRGGVEPQVVPIVPLILIGLAVWSAVDAYNGYKYLEANPIEVLEHGRDSTLYCVTPKQMEAMVGLLGLALIVVQVPGEAAKLAWAILKKAGTWAVQRAIARSVDEPVKVRVYYLGPPLPYSVPYFVFEGSCATPTPTPTATPTATATPTPAAGATTRVSLSSDGAQANGGSSWPSISADGRYVAFYSWASNLVAGDTNNETDVFVQDRMTGQTTRVSVSSDGTQGNSGSYYLSISGDGRYVAFDSDATNLVSGDTNGLFDIFVRDRQGGLTTRVSVASDGTQGNGRSRGVDTSADGRYVAFYSEASNLVAGDTNGVPDIFMHDRQTGQTIRVSVASDGSQGNASSEQFSMSADGRYIAFGSAASNLVAGDTNGVPDIFVHDRQTGQTTRVSVSSDGTQGNGPSYGGASISADGRYVAFVSHASNLVAGDTNGVPDIFVRDRQTGQTVRVSVSSDGTQANGSNVGTNMSVDGRYVVFESGASNLVAGDTNGVSDIFVHDRQTGQTTCVSVSSDGTQGNGPPGYGGASISADGRYVAFVSYASNLVAGDTNGAPDVFVHQRW